MRTFVYSDEKSKKFWNIDLNGASFVVTFGKVGSNDLLKKHGRQWLGDAGRFLFGEWSGSDKPYH